MTMTQLLMELYNNRNIFINTVTSLSKSVNNLNSADTISERHIWTYLFDHNMVTWFQDYVEHQAGSGHLSQFNYLGVSRREAFEVANTLLDLEDLNHPVGFLIRHVEVER